MGWYAMALVDVLEFIPQHEAGRDSLLDILNNVAVQVKKLQDPKTGGWYQVMDRSGDKGNYVESSCSAMFIYSLFKAVRLGYIDKSYLDVALKGLQRIPGEFYRSGQERIGNHHQGLCSGRIGRKGLSFRRL